MTDRTIMNVRKNVDFIAATQWLDEQGLDWEVCKSKRGHPYLQIGKVKFRLASSPKGRQQANQVIGSLKKRLRGE